MASLQMDDVSHRRAKMTVSWQALLVKAVLPGMALALTVVVTIYANDRTWRSSIDELESRLSRSLELHMIKMLENAKLKINTKIPSDIEPNEKLITDEATSKSLPDFDPTLTSWVHAQVQSAVEERLKGKTSNFPDVSSLQNDVRILQSKNSLNTKLPRTCLEYLSFGVTESGRYQIDPDGHGTGLPPIWVQCNFGKGGQTEVEHDTEDWTDVTSCEGASCFERRITYVGNATLGQIKNLIELSDTCHQKIEFKCFMAGLDGFASWTDLNGQRHAFLDDFKSQEPDLELPSEMTCGCRRNDTCRKTSRRSSCNCDSMPSLNAWQNDWGVIHNHSMLPIAAFHYGHLHGGEYKAMFRVLRLQCSGWAPIPPGAECAKLKLNGHLDSGLQVVRMYTNPSIVQCDMSRQLMDPSMQKVLGTLMLKENQKKELWTATLNSTTPAMKQQGSYYKWIGFKSSDSSLSTNGTFNCPEDGFYVAYLIGTITPLSYGDAYIFKGASSIWSKGFDGGHKRGFDYNAMFLLRAGEQLSIHSTRIPVALDVNFVVRKVA